MYSATHFSFVNRILTPPNVSKRNPTTGGFEILNNGSDINYVRFTPTDTPDELAYCNLEYNRMRGKIKIIKNPALTTKEKKSSSQ